MKDCDFQKWYENITSKELVLLHRIAGTLDLPIFDKYESKEHFLNDVYSRIVESKSLIVQAKKCLGG